MIEGENMAMKTRYSGAARIVFAGMLILGLGAPNAFAQTIKKCQDADGKWHYGDFADQACGNTTVDKIDKTGTKVGEDAPPPTAEELAEKEMIAKALKEQKEFSKKQRKEDLETIRIYGSEETIISTRDRKLESIDNNIDVTRQIKAGTLQDIEKLEQLKKTKKVKRQLLERENAVKSYNRVIRHNLTEREKLSEKYITILTQFREAHQRVYGE
jgi:hypothetical protein